MPASTMSNAVGPEPRSKVDPMALGAVAEPVDWRLDGAGLPISLDRSALSGPACASTRAVFDGTAVTGVVFAGVVFAGPDWFVGFEPPPPCRHST